jgi:cyclic dehypoxanthinyl futalosine synthase
MLSRQEPTDYILEKAATGERITPAEALALYERGNFLRIADTAREIRDRRLDPMVVTYTMFRVVNYTTFCNVDCSFCSYFEPPGSPRGVTLSREEIVQKMREAVAIGADQMFLQGGVNPELPFDYYLDVIRAVKRELGSQIHVRAFSPVELIGMERLTGMPLRSILRELKAAGMDSVPGAGAEILTDRMRSLLSPQKAGPAEWVRVMETCHEEGLPGSANIVFGSEETPGEIVEHLRLVRDLQDRTSGFLAFIPWTFQQQTKRFRTRHVPPHEFLKVLGICRIFLDNIRHIETSVMVLGQSTGALALHAGADDISSVVIEENVLKNYGLKTEDRAREFIRDSGFTPARRDLLYRLQSPAESRRPAIT